MPAESVEENILRKAIQELVIPIFNEIKDKMDASKERINSTNTIINSTNERIGSLRNELKADIAHLETELKQDIEHLSEKVDLMNKFNERLFNLLHPAGQK